MGGAHLPADTTPSLQSNIFPLQLVFSCSTHAAEGQGREDLFLRLKKFSHGFFTEEFTLSLKEFYWQALVNILLMRLDIPLA